MELYNLSPAAGSTKEAFRKGRGHGSGNGKTGGRGRKGQKARSGGGVRVGFAGGQLPLARRSPQRGYVQALRPFTNQSQQQSFSPRALPPSLQQQIRMITMIIHSPELPPSPQPFPNIVLCTSYLVFTLSYVKPPFWFQSHIKFFLF